MMYMLSKSMLTDPNSLIMKNTLRTMPKQSSKYNFTITDHYYTTKLLGGLIHKIHQSDRAIAGLIFSKYQTGSVRIRPEVELFKMADAEEIEVCKLSPRNTKQFWSRRRGPPTLSLVWACETICEDQRKLRNMKTLRTAAELPDFIEEHKSNLTR